MKQKIGFIGLGIMGFPAAVNLLRGGFDVVGYSLDNLGKFAAAGGIVAASSAEVAKSADIIVHCLPLAEALDDVVYGPNGILKTLRPGSVVIELSSYALEDKERLLTALNGVGAHLLDCEMTSRAGQETVANREFCILISGDPKTCETMQPVFDGMTDNSFYIGPFGSSLTVKLVINHLVSIHIMAAVETISLGIKAGLDPNVLIGLLEKSAGDSAVIRKYGSRIATRSFDENIGGTVRVFSKYFNLIETLARSAEAATPLFHITHQYYRRALEAGFEKRDISSIFEILHADR